MTLRLHIVIELYSPAASPGKGQVAVPSSLQPTAGINGANNGCAGGTISAAPSSSASDMNRSPNNTLRMASGIAASNAPTTASRATEKVFYLRFSSHYAYYFLQTAVLHVHVNSQPKEKKDKCVSLMRRLTNIKKSKSPPPATYSMDNPVFDDGNSVNPMHVR